MSGANSQMLVSRTRLTKSKFTASVSSMSLAGPCVRIAGCLMFLSLRI